MRGASASDSFKEQQQQSHLNMILNYTVDAAVSPVQARLKLYIYMPIMKVYPAKAVLKKGHRRNWLQLGKVFGAVDLPTYLGMYPEEITYTTYLLGTVRPAA